MYLQLMMNLGLVIIFILIYGGIMFWLNKKRNGINSGLEIVASLPMTNREKILLVKVSDERFLIGVTQHQISLLASFQEKNDTNIMYQDVMQEVDKVNTVVLSS